MRSHLNLSDLFFRNGLARQFCSSRENPRDLPLRTAYTHNHTPPPPNFIIIHTCPDSSRQQGCLGTIHSSTRRRTGTLSRSPSRSLADTRSRTRAPGMRMTSNCRVLCGVGYQYVVAHKHGNFFTVVERQTDKTRQTLLVVHRCVLDKVRFTRRGACGPIMDGRAIPFGSRFVSRPCRGLTRA